MAQKHEAPTQTIRYDKIVVGDSLLIDFAIPLGVYDKINEYSLRAADYSLEYLVKLDEIKAYRIAQAALVSIFIANMKTEVAGRILPNDPKPGLTKGKIIADYRSHFPDENQQRFHFAINTYPTDEDIEILQMDPLERIKLVGIHVIPNHDD